MWQETIIGGDIVDSEIDQQTLAAIIQNINPNNYVPTKSVSTAKEA